jgi:imidazole glycerol-phosphate synthase subunit HisF
MLQTRVIPCLLLRNTGLYKTVGFKDPKYVGDPINAVRIFNEKEVDELVVLDIDATRLNTSPNFSLLADIASEAFMPFAYGGGISSIEHIRTLYALGVEKVIINTAAACNPKFLSEASALAGSSGVVAGMDVKRNWLGKYSVYVRAGQDDIKVDPVTYAKTLERLGAGEILLSAIDKDGRMDGYDLELLRKVSSAVSVPVVAVGGAGKLEHFREAQLAGASAVSAGSMFVFHGKHKAVLITYPEYSQLEELLCHD